MNRFEAQVILITGAGSGIGRGAAVAFAAEGARVVVSDVDEANGRETVALLPTDRAIFVHCDVADASQVDKLVRQIIEHYGRLDVAINNAGVGGEIAKLADVTMEDYQKVMRINLDGVFFGMQAQIRQMLTQEKGGCIVNVASLAGLRAMPDSAAYTATKHAVVGLTKVAALEYARKNIRVNAVCPAFTRSGMVDRLFDIVPEYEEKLLKGIPVGRYGEPEDIALAMLWLCDPTNSFVTGLALPLDGGMMAN